MTTINSRGHGRECGSCGTLTAYRIEMHDMTMVACCGKFACERRLLSNSADFAHGINVHPSHLPTIVDTMEGELAPLRERIEKGRAKYPNGCTVLSLLDEAGEFAHAVNKGEGMARVRDELLDVAAVAMRLYLEEIDDGLAIHGMGQRRMFKAKS